jgi:hypothetical protein
MNTPLPDSPIQYKQHGPQTDSVCNHPAHPCLYGTDEVTSPSDCPFPLITESFRVLLYGRETGNKAGGLGTWALIEYVKGCGHKVHERIRFEEGVQDFDHYGTKFTGASYSVNGWQNRIEFFRSGPCDVCQTIQDALWHWKAGHTAKNRAKHEQSTLRLLDWNYANWQDFVNFDTFRTELATAKHGSI